MKERVPVPALQPYIIEPIWKQFSALLPEREVEHPLGCHRSRIPDRTVFEGRTAGCCTKALIYARLSGYSRHFPCKTTVS